MPIRFDFCEDTATASAARTPGPLGISRIDMEFQYDGYGLTAGAFGSLPTARLSPVPCESNADLDKRGSSPDGQTGR